MSRELLERPAYRPLWSAARRRVEARGLSLGGTPLTLKGLTDEEADAIAGLLGVRRPTAGTLRVSLATLDRTLRSSAVGLGLLDVLSELGGPLVDRRALKGEHQAHRARQWADLAAHPSVQGDPGLGAWLEHVRTTGLARRLAGDGDAKAVSNALDVLAALEGSPGRHRLAVLAADVMGDAHALDRGKPVGTLAVHALSWLAGRPYPQDAADWRRTWSDAGVACDDLSCDVLVLNLPGSARRTVAPHPSAGVDLACPCRGVPRRVRQREPGRGRRCCRSPRGPLAAGDVPRRHAVHGRPRPPRRARSRGS